MFSPCTGSLFSGRWSEINQIAERWFAAHLYTIFIDTPLIPYIGTADMLHTCSRYGSTAKRYQYVMFILFLELHICMIRKSGEITVRMLKWCITFPVSVILNYFESMNSLITFMCLINMQIVFHFVFHCNNALYAHGVVAVVRKHCCVQFMSVSKAVAQL